MRIWGRGDEEVTLAVEDEMLRAAREYARGRGTTVRAPVRRDVADVVRKDDRIEETLNPSL
jgi:hypothetical protein